MAGVAADSVRRLVADEFVYVQEKELYRVTFAALRTHLEGVDVVMKATKKSEICPDLFESRCKSADNLVGNSLHDANYRWSNILRHQIHL
jgi:hypothetical protein